MPIIGIILFIYLIIKIDLVTILLEIKNANKFFLFLAFIMVIVMFCTETFKWFFIALFQGVKLPFLEAMKINLISNFYGFVTPSKLGTVIRAEYLKKYTKSFGKGFFNFTIDKVMDLLSVTFVAIVFSFIFKDKLNIPIGVFFMFFLILILGTLFFIKKERSKRFLGFFYKKFIPKKLKSEAKMAFDSFYDHVPKIRYFPLFFVFNLLNWIVIYLVSYFIGLSLGINLSFIFYLGILPLGTLVTLIPISINGLGTREVTLISLFALFGIGSAKVFSMSIISLFFGGILPAIIGGILIIKFKNN